MADVEENTMLQGMGVTGSLARNKVPFAVVSLGVVTVLLAMFLPELTHGTVERGYETVTNFRHYLLLCTLAAVVGMLRFSVTGSKGAADFVIMDGSIYLGSILYCALELYLFAEGGDNAAAGQVLWEAGIGCLLVCAGGLLLRFPELNLLAGKIFRNG